MKNIIVFDGGERAKRKAKAMQGFRLAMGQMLVEGGEPGRNLDRAAGVIGEAAGRGCKVVVLPECLDLGWTHPSAAGLAEPVPGAFTERLAREARAAGVYVAAGLNERAGARLYNSAVLISPEGEILLTHRKINVLFPDIYAVGDRLGVAETPLGMMGLDICADNFPGAVVLGSALARMGAECILSPSAWAVTADHDNTAASYGEAWERSYSTLAHLYDLTVVGVSNVGPVTGGPWAGRKCIGCSLAVGPGPRVLAKGPYGIDAVALIEIDVERREDRPRGTAFKAHLERKGARAVSLMGRVPPEGDSP